MEKKVKVITAFDFSDGKDESVFVQAAVNKKGEIHILRTGTVPFVPAYTPKPTAEVYEGLRKSILNSKISLSPPVMPRWINTSHYIHDPKIGDIGRISRANTYRPPSTHKRTYKKGRKIKSVQSFVNHLVGQGHIYYNHKFMHNGFAWGLSLRTVLHGSVNGRIWKAVRL